MLDLKIIKPIKVNGQVLRPGDDIPVELDGRTIAKFLRCRRLAMVHLPKPDLVASHEKPEPVPVPTGKPKGKGKKAMSPKPMPVRESFD